MTNTKGGQTKTADDMKKLEAEKRKIKETKYQSLERRWRKVAMILMPIILVLNFTINILEIYSPRDEQRGFNYPEFIL